MWARISLSPKLNEAMVMGVFELDELLSDPQALITMAIANTTAPMAPIRRTGMVFFLSVSDLDFSRRREGPSGALCCLRSGRRARKGRRLAAPTPAQTHACRCEPTLHEP